MGRGLKMLKSFKLKFKLKSVQTVWINECYYKAHKFYLAGLLDGKKHKDGKTEGKRDVAVCNVCLFYFVRWQMKIYITFSCN